MSNEEWSIQELAKAAGTTSRTLRHYGDLGLLRPSRVGTNGYRYYDRNALVRLQRVLLLRELGLGLPAIAQVLDGAADANAALRTHLDLLRLEQDRITRQITSVSTTLYRIEKGEPLMAAEVLDGFDNSQYRDEVVERWGQAAWDDSQDWWRSQSDKRKHDFQQEHVDLAAAYGRAHAEGVAPDSPQVGELVARHRAWIGRGWGNKPVSDQALRCLGQMYVDDERFAVNYNKYGDHTAEYVRDAIFAHTEVPAE